MRGNLASASDQQSPKAGWGPGRTGSVTAIQRFGSALNLNVHFHSLFLGCILKSRREGFSGRLGFDNESYVNFLKNVIRLFFLWAERWLKSLGL